MNEKTVNLCNESEAGGANVAACVRAERGACVRLYVHAQHWLINKTGLPLHMKVRTRMPSPT